jgi:DNA-binding transcriptional MerR regulator
MMLAMPDETAGYSLSDLSDLASVTPRTVRYYVQQGLLRSPDVAGPNTRYEEGHLWRLRLIRQLQRDHLPLAEIRKRLSALTDEEVQALVGGRPVPPQDSAVDYIRTVLGARGMPVPPPPMAAAAPPPQQAVSSVRVSEMPAAGYGPAPPGAAVMTPAQPDRSQWERVALSPDVELHIRRPLSRDHNRRVDRLISIARQLLEEDTP